LKKEVAQELRHLQLRPRKNKETTMTQNTNDIPNRVGFFATVTQADQAVRDLRAAGFTDEQLAVICPEQCKDQFPHLRHPDPPGSHAVEAAVEGGAVGAALGGLALIAAAVATGGAGLLTAVPVLVGGGAIAGGFGNLIVREGYGEGVAEYYEEAIHQGRIVVGVEDESPDSDVRLAEAERILVAEGAEIPMPHKG
jgi:hypothetical protein